MFCSNEQLPGPLWGGNTASGLAIVVLAACVLGFVGAAVTVSLVSAREVLCDSDVCPDGIAFILPARVA